MIGIYKITSPNGKIYIGQSINIDRRFKSYRKLQREKLSGQLNYLSKIILNTETGVFYYGLREASNSCHLSKSVIHINITKNKKNKTNFIYV